jgi:hypothetical protein
LNFFFPPEQEIVLENLARIFQKNFKNRELAKFVKFRQGQKKEKEAQSYASSA